MVSPLGNFRSEVFICVLLEPSIIARSILGWTSSQSDQNNNLFQKHGVRCGTFKERMHYKKTCLTKKTFTSKSCLAGICPFPFSEEKKRQSFRCRRCITLEFCYVCHHMTRRRHNDYVYNREIFCIPYESGTF